jgi:oligopeptidase B
MSLEARPPKAPQIPHEITFAGHTRTDPFFWLKDDEPAARKYLEEENRYAETLLAPSRKLQEELYTEISARIPEQDASLTQKMGDYYYYVRAEPGEQYPVYCRKKGSLDGAEQVILNANQFARGHKHFHLGVFSVSPDQKLIAFSADADGSEKYTLRVRNLETGELLAEIKNSNYEPVPPGRSFAWGNDSRTFFYTQADETCRMYKVLKFVLGTNTYEGQTVYEEHDNRLSVDLFKSRSQQVIFIAIKNPSAGEFAREVRYLIADEPNSELQVLCSREADLLYSVAHHRNRFFVATYAKRHKNFNLFEAAIGTAKMEHWINFMACGPEAITGIDAFENHLVLLARREGLPAIQIIDLNSKASHWLALAFEEPSYSLTLGNNLEFGTRTLQVVYSSFTTPRVIIDYEMSLGQPTKIKETTVPNYDRANYTPERVWATAHDGAAIPISLFYKKGFEPDGSAPLWITAYGALGIAKDPIFNSELLSLVDRGFVYAICHVRGGGEFGLDWHEQGKLLSKINTFTDFICCTEFLIYQGYAAPNKITIQGRSAGGTLIGAVVNMRPDLYSTVVAEVPVVDALNEMSDPSQPCTTMKYLELGNPGDAQIYPYIASYSAYENVPSASRTAERYPNVFVRAAWNDFRLRYWQPAKWAAKLRTLGKKIGLVVFQTNMEAGHLGASGRLTQLKETTIVYAFAIDIIRKIEQAEKSKGISTQNIPPGNSISLQTYARESRTVANQEIATQNDNHRRRSC